MQRAPQQGLRFRKDASPDLLSSLDFSNKNDLIRLRETVSASKELPAQIVIPLIKKLGTEAGVPIEGIRHLTDSQVSGNSAADYRTVMLNSALNSFINTAINNAVNKEINSEIFGLAVAVRQGRDTKEVLYNSIEHGNIPKAAKMAYLLRRETAENAVTILGEALTDVTAFALSNINDDSAEKNALAERQSSIAKLLLGELHEMSKMVEWKRKDS
ncbi:MAG: hypothetical protein KGH98_01400 [Candidatus Micrarchaeota archaeon]|nr:hypothetical protein [Candidatus Micrarchaeota archaeon]